MWLWKGFLDRGRPRPTAGLSGKRRLIIYPFYFRWRSTKQLAQSPLSQSHWKGWVPWILGIDRESMLLQGQTYNLTLCIACQRKNFPWCQIKDHQGVITASKGGLWESFLRSHNTKQLTDQGQWRVDRDSYWPLIVTRHLQKRQKSPLESWKKA